MSAETRPGTIGIIGAGHIGQAFARVAQRAGTEVLIANSRGPESLSPVVAALGDGVSAGTVGEAAASPLVVIAVPWASVPAAVGLVWNGEIVIDATNAWSSLTPLTCSPRRSMAVHRVRSWRSSSLAREW
jgi:predicted dinucleotide-binding enzyme